MSRLTLHLLCAALLVPVAVTSRNHEGISVTTRVWMTH